VATLIGLWTSFVKIGKNIDYLGRNLTKLSKNTQNVEKLLNFKASLGRGLATPDIANQK
jgi:hypothetical protein